MHAGLMNTGAAKSTVNEDELVASSSMVKIIISHGSHQLEIVVPAHSTFGELKGALAKKTGMRPQEQKLLFRGKERNDKDFLLTAGVKNEAKLILVQESTGKDHRFEENHQHQDNADVCEAVRRVTVEVDKLAEKVHGLAIEVEGGARISDKEFIVLPELLMRQLLKLDSIEAEGETRVQRRSEVQRVQRLVETLDVLKAKNDDPFSRSSSKEVSVVKEWETFESTSPARTEAPACTTQDWVQFD